MSRFTGKYMIDATTAKEWFEKEDVLFVDARGEEVASEGMVDGAIVLFWTDLCRTEGLLLGSEGWGDLFDAKTYEEKLGALGLDLEKKIVIYADANKGFGEDGWVLWMLRACGFQHLYLVDGGYEALKNEGILTTTNLKKHAPIKLSLAMSSNGRIRTDELLRRKHEVQLVDVREVDEFGGEVKFGEKRGGHIPGAINIPLSQFFQENGLLKDKETIKALFVEKGIDSNKTVVPYCTGGIRSAFASLLLDMCGFENVRNYEGSYYCWCAQIEA